MRKSGDGALSAVNVVFTRGGREFGMGYYHWFFLAQPAPLPERLIGADPDWWWHWHTNRGPRDDIFVPRALDKHCAWGIYTAISKS